MNLRPYVWNNLSYTGDKYSSIAIVDSGIDGSHSFFKDKIIGWYDVSDENSEPYDAFGHGTHCAGIAAGNGVKQGVAKDATLYAYKALNSGGSGSFSNVIAAIERSVLLNL